MKTIHLLLPLLIAAGTGFGQTQPAGRTPAKEGEMQQLNGTLMKAPESVCIHGNDYYISDTGGDPTKKDGDGVLYKMNSNGEVTVFASGLDSPKGLWVLNNILYTPDVDKIKGFDLSTGKQVFTLDMAATGSEMLNDITPMNDSILFVSATDISKVYMVYLGAKPRYKELIFPDSVKGVNGLAYDSKLNRLYVCGFGIITSPVGEISYVQLGERIKEVVHLTRRGGYYDGIALTNRNTLLVSDWESLHQKHKGVVVELDLATGNLVTVNKEPIPGPADFTLNEQGDIIIPAMMEGKVLRFTPRH